MSEKEYLQSVALANEWMRAYYEKDAPLASDEEYDALIRRLREFESTNPSLVSANSPTQKVAPNIQSEFSKLKHSAKMWSMEDIFSEAELIAWAKRAKYDTISSQTPNSLFESKNSQNSTQNSLFSELESQNSALNSNDDTFFVEPKFDGASLNLTYENGELVSGATRGDGEVGEDITQNVRVISSIPQRINYKERIEIRGEILILKADFDELNQRRAASGQSLFANPRNAASGSLRQLDTSITKERNLKFYPWGVGENSLNFKKHSEVMDFVRSLGFLKDDFVRVCGSLAEVIAAYKELLSKRESKAMMMDGMVVRLNNLEKCAQLGYTVKFPRFMAAFKFPALEKTTTLLGVNLQVGRSGVITPVAVLEAVVIEGVTVRSATLHNFDEIARLDAKIGDKVSIIRSGDVIPKITRVFTERRTGSERGIARPTHCPECNGELLDEGILIKCQNLSCKARVVGALIYFVSKKCLNIDGLGASIVEFLFKEGKIKSVEDIFFLKHADFEGLEGFKDKKINNLLNAIQNARKTQLYRFINALGIEHIGEVAAKKIARNFGKAWIDKSEGDFSRLEDFGEVMARSVSEFLRVNYERILKFYELLDFDDLQNSNLNSQGLNSQGLTQDLQGVSQILAGKSFVITGTLSRPRDEFSTLIESLGGKVSGSVSSKTNFVLYGENAGSKFDKAQSLGVRCIDESEFNALIEGE